MRGSNRVARPVPASHRTTPLASIASPCAWARRAYAVTSDEYIYNVPTRVCFVSHDIYLMVFDGDRTIRNAASHKEESFRMSATNYLARPAPDFGRSPSG